MTKSTRDVRNGTQIPSCGSGISRGLQTQFSNKPYKKSRDNITIGALIKEEEHKFHMMCVINTQYALKSGIKKFKDKG